MSVESLQSPDSEMASTSTNEISYKRHNDSEENLNSSKRIRRSPSVSTPPEVNSTEPEVNSTEPEVNSREPEVNSTEPEVNSRESEVNSTEPEINSTEPEINTESNIDMNLDSQPDSRTEGTEAEEWDPSEEFEVENIVGYHRDREGNMWYYLKWKDWSEEHNTYEDLDNMAGCNFMLMQHFEYRKASPKHIARQKRLIVKSLQHHELYLNLKRSNYKRKYLKEFSRNHLDISKLFQSKDDYISFRQLIQEEYGYIIRCLIGMKYHVDKKMFARAQNYKICLELAELRRKQLLSLTSAEEKINSMEKCHIKVENNLDLEHYPDSLIYITDLLPSKHIKIPDDPPVGCECPDGCSIKSNCCGKMSGSYFAYSTKEKIRHFRPFWIFECNKKCTCPLTCNNRVIQRGRKFELCIFKTKHCGWGVKALTKIPKGTFICEYIGEVIEDAEAEIREKEYPQSQISYLFDMNCNPGVMPNKYTVDSSKYGNFSRFINHSCNPSLGVFLTWINCVDKDFPRLAFFTLRNIEENEEINFDYESVSEFNTEQNKRGNRNKNKNKNTKNDEGKANETENNFNTNSEDDEDSDEDNVTDNEENDREDGRKTPGMRKSAKIICKCKAPNCRKVVLADSSSSG